MNQAQVKFLQAQGLDVPDHPVEQRLFLMGFDAVERQRIMEVAQIPGCLIGAIEIGEFIMAGRPLQFISSESVMQRMGSLVK